MSDSVILALVMVLLFCIPWLAFIPVLPAAALQWTVIVLYAVLTQFSEVTAVAAVVVTALLAVSLSAGIWLPWLGFRGKTMSCSTLVAFFVGCVVGIFIPIPIIGSLVGGVGAVMLWAFWQGGQMHTAMQQGGAALKVVLMGLVVECVLCWAMFAVVVVSVLWTA
jgi:uncharacterized protein YqgC (DUF456 family)